MFYHMEHKAIAVVSLAVQFFVYPPLLFEARKNSISYQYCCSMSSLTSFYHRQARLLETFDTTFMVKYPSCACREENLMCIALEERYSQN